MTTEQERRDRLDRKAEIYEQRLERDIDALARRVPVQAVRELKEHGPAIRRIAIGVAVGLAVTVLVLATVRVVRAFS
jgi:hypothetical protein